MKKQLAVLTLAFLAIGGLVHAGGEGDKKDLKALEGAWTWSGDGKKIDLKITGSKFAITFDDKATFQGTVKVDTSKKPKQIDMAIEEGPAKEITGKTSVGIYEIEGGSFKWASAEPGLTKRPAAFPSKEGDLGMEMYIIMKKAKK